MAGIIARSAVAPLQSAKYIKQKSLSTGQINTYMAVGNRDTRDREILEYRVDAVQMAWVYVVREDQQDFVETLDNRTDNDT
ncbi:hypothetical protein [Lihuaxuella thermophila]|uniref:Uncharacterized protein n=1 Tax=Lihuaxuella thermophila TaxID=1173111 RepID=A0A1H8BP54_9BACL|nr:hypothetical protein [Lihuaxuella thermophila]SEM84583.1 hypothetical protein SAMN05444955_102288 [Lihuaxuella thermophila]